MVSSFKSLAFEDSNSVYCSPFGVVASASIQKAAVSPIFM